MTKFSTHCFRDFKKFIGELTANAAGIYVAAQFAGENLSKDENDPWSVLAKTYGVKVDGIKTAQILRSSSRLNMVSIYSGFDLYLSSFRKEYNSLSKKSWAKEDKEGPFDEIRNNFTATKVWSIHSVAKEMLEVLDYYRLFRNSVAHPSEKDEKSAIEAYKSSEKSRVAVSHYYKMKTAPNAPEDINFHDVKLFSRILLDLLPKLDELLDPGDESLLSLVPTENWSLLSKKRQKNARIGYLVNKYGLERERAEKIIGSLA